MAGSVNVRLADGRVAGVPEHAVQAVIAEGGHVLTGAEVAEERRLKQEYDRNDINKNATEMLVRPPLAALVEGLNAATFGGLDYVGSKFAGAEYREGRELLRKDSPTASDIGGIAGSVLGLGKVAQVARAGAGALRLGRLAAAGAEASSIAGRAGLAATSAAEAGARAGAEAARTAIAGRVLSGAARVGAEVAAMDAGAELSRQSLAGEPLDPAAIARRAGAGALSGAALGGAFGLAGAGARRLFSRAERVADPALTGEAVIANGGKTVGAERATALASDDAAAIGESEAGVAAGSAMREPGAAVTQATGKPASTFDSLAEKYIKSRPGSPEHTKLLADAWENRAELAKGHAAIVDDAAREFSKALDAQQAAARVTDMSSFGESKIKQAAALVDRSNVEAQRTVLGDWLARATEEIEPLYKRGTSGLTKKEYKLFQAWSDQLQSAIDDGDSLEMFTTADKLKRFIGKQARYGKSALGLPDAAKTFAQLYQRGAEEYGAEGIREALESPVWGALGDAQRNVNAATSRMISQGEYFDSKFVTKFGEIEGRPTWAANTSAVSGLMNGLTSAAADLDARAVREYVETRLRFLEKVQEHYDTSGAYGLAIEKEQTALQSMRETFDRTSKKVELANLVKSEVEAEKSRAFSSAYLRPLNYAITPVTNLQALASLEETTSALFRRSESKTQQFVRGAQGGLPAPPPRARGFFSQLLEGSERTLRAGVRSTPTVLAGAAGMRARYNLKVDQVASLASNPDALAARVNDAISEPARGEPEVAAAAASTAARGVGYLASRVPSSGKDKYALQPQFKAQSRASDADVSKFMRAASAIDNPLSLLDEARRGSLTRDHVDAVKTVYPELYRKIQTQIFNELVNSKSELPYAKRIQLSILLDIPTDKTLSPEFHKAIQATYAQSASRESAKAKPVQKIELTNSEKTATQAVISRL